MAKILVGTSGWMYKHWGDVFYPENIRGKQQLPFFAEHFDTVEINSTFYHIPRSSGVQHWADSTPTNFRFAIKLNRYLTHRKKLILDESSCDRLDSFIDATKPLRAKTSALLVQIPPGFRANFARLDEFLAHLRRQTAYRRTDICFEPRHQSWLEGKQLEQILRQHRVGFVIGTHPGKFQPPYPITSPAVYLRFHATAEHPDYSPAQLRRWVDYVAGLPTKVKRVYVYFNNDFEGWAITNAEYFKHQLD